MKDDLLGILEHMIEDCQDISAFITEVATENEMWNNKMCRKAIIMSILNLGELTKLLEKHIELPMQKIDWKGLKGMREIAAHRYRTLSSDIVWDVAVNEIPEIYEFLKQQRENIV